MARKTTNRDIENNHSVNADINGDGNKTTQAGRDLIQGDYNKIPDEGRAAADPFSIFFEIAYSIGQFLFKMGIEWEFAECGKDKCRCHSGDESALHGPYLYRYYRENGKLQDDYVKTNDRRYTKYVPRAIPKPETPAHARKHQT